MTPMSASRFNSEWKSLFHAVLSERDPTKLPERISAARRAILNAVEASIHDPHSRDQYAMDAALRTLRRVAQAYVPAPSTHVPALQQHVSCTDTNGKNRSV
jgi:hypothetical protein